MESFLIREGYAALMLLGFLESCCVPVSSEVTFGFAGVLAYQGHLRCPRRRQAAQPSYVDGLRPAACRLRWHGFTTTTHQHPDARRNAPFMFAG